MPQRRRSDGPRTFVWVRGPRGPEPQIWGEEARIAGERTRETVVLATRELSPDESRLPLRALAARYPAPAETRDATDD
ncbi:hypothetical protein JQ557_00015 [Bradyrhizobium sp. U87765 SZCCT0131]|uniref:hypothetical protein n=1 Tax=unclassified Bradyrhizobium TaxID=2631580 RepID=UPI001BA72E83|nr:MULTISPECIES: hypothetical protein [unclassified Bradyrhizobium]MBR1216356.1 hypothetical protein [Bradyrhizobium sp. U87765 SZCCT0131]MBR1259896.1 hypothetical protein [Bradyrhizobium sp. U87765 SZCCT0134]MBR1306029.1 hypothetical protein [Bradyrhizobium sp. U87765 SZCCT0110]MBR1322396.1 hypothetical protein [Bradyrhizobium sp. U87765 SZCCT0109]MBR1352313.1 hypothetical protein [Bradyrhizobium sp. U87765 SZCCT0048]